MNDPKFRARLKSEDGNESWYYINIPNHPFTVLTLGLEQVTPWEQYTHLTDQDNREIYAGDIYEMFGQVHMIIAVYTHGLRFMWGDEQLTNAITKYGIYRGNVHENPGVLSK